MTKKIFLVSSILFLLFFLALRAYISNNLIFKENIITQEEFDNIISNREEYKDFLELKYNNNSIPFDKVNNYFLLSQVEGKKYNGSISIDNFEIDVLKNNMSKDEIISSNGNLSLLAYNNKYYKIINLKMTYLPVVKLDNFSDKVTIYDNNLERNVLDIQTHAMEYHIRGASTSGSAKPSYKLNILSSKGNKKKVSLLNMREDDDWILNSMTTDRSYMLEKIGWDMWKEIHGSSLELKYTELFIDNEYKGIYCLQEPADFKTYNANKNKSVIVSVKGWPVKENAKLFNENLKYDVLIDEFELDSKMDANQQIELLRAFASDVKEIEYSSKVKLNYDIDSIVNYSLFINMISAIDNTYKNQKILFRYVDGEYSVEVHPWDLDRSQNNENVMHEEDFLRIVDNVNIPKEILQSESYKKALEERYFELRKSVYNEEFVDALIIANRNELEKSGAILREEVACGDRDLAFSEKIIKDFYSNKIKLLDDYYGGN